LSRPNHHDADCCTSASHDTQPRIEPNTRFSSEDVWRGACASRRRDRRLRLLQATVRCVHSAPDYR
jgi:hypothetical protein